jgi:phage/plasmid-like protein (TIGR03299 family)
MPHEINRLVFVGQVPWHGLGTRLPQNASFDDIVEAAGFFTVAETPVYVPGKLDPIPETKALVREDTHDVLAVVSDRYEVVQAEEVARTLIEAARGVRAIFHTAGSLGRNGSRFWLLGELPGPMKIRGDASEIRKYILGTSAHDGASPVIIQNVGTRVVCANTLGSALGEKTKARWQIRHTRSAPERLREAARGFREIVDGYKQFEQLANELAITRLTDAGLLKVIDQVLPVPDDDRDHSRIEASRAKVIELFENGVGMQGIRGTGWAGLQSFSEFADHHRGVRGANGNPAAARLESIWLGGAAELKRRALTAIADQVRIPLAA